MDHSENTKKYSICKLQPNIRISSDDKVFILQVLNEEKQAWEDKFYYSWIGDALRGYVIYVLQEFARMDIDGGIKELAKKIENISTTIEQASDDLESKWNQFIEDPIESEIRSNGDV